MATWQADFELIPRLSFPADFRVRLARILPEGKSWSPEIVTFGIMDGTRIDVYLSAGQPTDGFVRIDMRQYDPQFTEGLLGFVVATDLRLVAESGIEVEPNRHDLARALAGSPAARFVADPAAFLRRVELGGHEDA